MIYQVQNISIYVLTQYVAQYDVIAILFGNDMMPDMLDVLDAFDNAAPHIQAACLVAVGLV